MPLFRRLNQVHRLVASSQKSGAPNLRLFQPYLRRRQTSLSQPCSRLTGVVFHGALLLPRGFASDDGSRDVKSNSQQMECTICTESNLASSAFIIRCLCPANFGSQSSALWCQTYLRPTGRPTFNVQFGDCFNFT